MRTRLLPERLPPGTRLFRRGKVREGDWVLTHDGPHRSSFSPMSAEWMPVGPVGWWPDGSRVGEFFAVARPVKGGAK